MPLGTYSLYLPPTALTYISELNFKISPLYGVFFFKFTYPICSPLYILPWCSNFKKNLFLLLVSEGQIWGNVLTYPAPNTVDKDSLSFFFPPHFKIFPKTAHTQVIYKSEVLCPPSCWTLKMLKWSWNLNFFVYCIFFLLIFIIQWE